MHQVWQQCMRDGSWSATCILQRSQACGAVQRSAALAAAAHPQQQLEGHLLPRHPLCVSAPVCILDHKLLHTFLCLH